MQHLILLPRTTISRVTGANLHAFTRPRPTPPPFAPSVLSVSCSRIFVGYCGLEILGPLGSKAIKNFTHAEFIGALNPGILEV